MIVPTTTATESKRFNSLRKVAGEAAGSAELDATPPSVLITVFNVAHSLLSRDCRNSSQGHD